MYVSVLVRKLKPGKTVDDFVRAWYTGETLEQVMTRIAGQESVRHDRIDDVIESTTLRGIYEVVHEFDFSTDEAVAQGRPPGLTT